MRPNLIRALIFIVLAAGVVAIAFTASANNNTGNDAKSKLQTARTALKEAKRALGEQMDCCMEPACDFCALSLEHCPCGANIKAGKPICGNCADGWEAGLGDVPHIDKSKIKRLPGDVAKKMFDMRYQRK